MRCGIRPLILCIAVCAPVPLAAPATTHAAAASPSPVSTQAQLFGAHPVRQGQTTLPGGHFNYALVAGESVSDGVVVENFTDRSLDFHVYGADLLSAPGGGHAPAQPTDTMHEAGAWIIVSSPTVTIAAHSQLTDTFRVTAPSTASPGEHLGAVVAAAKVGTTQQGSSIEARTALITVVTVPGAAHPSAILNPLSTSPAVEGGLGFGITLANTGNMLLTYVGTVAVYDSHGHRIAKLPLTPPDAYVVPVGRAPLAAVWKETVPQSGAYTAQATVSILADGKPAGVLTSQSLALPMPSGPSSLIFIAIAVGSLLIVVTGPSILLLRWRRRRRARAWAPLIGAMGRLR